MSKKEITKPFKYILQAVVVRTDSSGKVTGEGTVQAENGQPFVFYSKEDLKVWVDGFEDELARADAKGKPKDPA